MKKPCNMWFVQELEDNFSGSSEPVCDLLDSFTRGMLIVTERSLIISDQT